MVNTWQQKAQANKKISVRHCNELIGLAPSRYFAIKQKLLPTKVDATALALKVAFTASGETYGGRRLTKALKAQGYVTGCHRVRDLMKDHHLVPVWKRRLVCTTDSQHGGRIAPNRVWVADITYIRTQIGWVYLATVMDLYSRKIVGWAMASHMRASLVCQALRIALITQQPGV